MAGDLVIIDSDCVERFRKGKGLSKLELYKVLGVCPASGGKIVSGRGGSLSIAKRVGGAMGISFKKVIDSWVER